MFEKLFPGLTHRRALRLMRRWERDPATPDTATAAQRVRDARALAEAAANAQAAAEAQLSAQRPLPDLPARTDWHHRGDPFLRRLVPPVIGGLDPTAQVSRRVSIHHDGDGRRLILRQTGSLPDLGLSLDVLDFAGTYVSIAVAVPDAALDGFDRNTVFRADMELTTSRPQKIFARFNLAHGPNIERVVRDLAPGARSAEFDFFQADLDTDAITGAWFDLIVQNPRDTTVDLGDLVLSRRPRAGL